MWVNESCCLRNKVLNCEEKNDFCLCDYIDILMIIFEYFYVLYGWRGF